MERFENYRIKVEGKPFAGLSVNFSELSKLGPMIKNSSLWPAIDEIWGPLQALYETVGLRVFLWD
jgi:hypothetical protein